MESASFSGLTIRHGRVIRFYLEDPGNASDTPALQCIISAQPSFKYVEICTAFQEVFSDWPACDARFG